MMMSMVMMMTLRMTVKLKSTKVNYLRWLHVPTVVPFYFFVSCCLTTFMGQSKYMVRQT